jgi:hypothetical protein
MMTHCQKISRPYKASRFRKKTDKPQYNHPLQCKYTHEVHGRMNANTRHHNPQICHRSWTKLQHSAEDYWETGCVTTFGQVVYKISPSHIGHLWQYTLTFNGQIGKHIWGRDLAPIVLEAAWAPEVVWTSVKNITATRIWSLDLPAQSELLYQLHYPGPPVLAYVKLTTQDQCTTL